MSDMDQTRILVTPEMLEKRCVNKLARGYVRIITIIALTVLCLALLLFLGGIGAVIDVVLIAVYVMLSKKEKSADVKKAYFYIMPMIDKRSGMNSIHTDIDTPYLDIAFSDAHGNKIFVDIFDPDEYEAANTGDLFYVGFYPNTEKAFTCLSCDRHRLDPSFENRGRI